MKVLAFINIFFLPIALFSQNLVSNGSFEEYNECPTDYSQHYYEPFVKYWDSPNAGTPDYFHSCSHKCGVPLNWVGNAEAFDGDAYMGIIACMYQIDKNQIAYREYIRIKLNDTLKQDTLYYASMHIRLGSSCNVSCNGIGMYFSNQKLSTSRKINYPFIPQVSYGDNRIVENKSDWTKVCGIFKAQGNETFLIIGNFLSNQQMQYRQLDENLILTQETLPMAYYLIDDVKVIPYHDSLKPDCVGGHEKEVQAFEGKLLRDEKLVLKNLHFESDRAKILVESYFELDQLVHALKRNTSLKINIHGHTDNTGGEHYNFELSEKRATAVKNYLIKKGISKFRITVKGFGDTKPISENKTEEGKQLNRRVEIEVY